MKGLKHHKNVGFSHAALQKKKEPHGTHYVKSRASLWIAVLSLFMFVAGNMIGQHGWYTFWASVLGTEDLSGIAYEGTVSPFVEVVDYGCWARYGGDYKVHTFRQSPQECRKSQPTYTSSSNRDSIYSMQYMSSYSATTEGTGTHPGVDIRVPVGTPVRAVMAGKVYKVGNQSNGFGNYIVLVHPNVPDPDNPNSSTITLYSNYGHLQSVLVKEGEILHKGDTIAYSGNTGQSTGPHLDFSVIREGAPFYPFYPSTQNEGYTYTVNPMLYVQSNYDAVSAPVLIADASDQRDVAEDPEEVVVPRRIDVAPEQVETVVAEPDEPREEVTYKSIIARLQARREARIRERLAERDNREIVIASNALQTGLIPSAPASTVEVLPEEDVPEVASESTVITNESREVVSVEISHDGYFSGRGWEKVTVRLLDEDGNTVIHPELNRDLVPRAAYGEAEFRPSILSPIDFVDGVATLNVLPRGRRTVVLKLLPFAKISKPMQFER